MKLNEAKLFEVLSTLGVTRTDFQVAVTSSTSFEDACNKLEALKTRVRRAAKLKRRQLHPDMNLGATEDELASAQQQLSDITDVLNALDHIQIRRMQPRPPPVVVVRTIYSNSSSTSGTDTFINNDFWPAGGNPFGS